MINIILSSIFPNVNKCNIISQHYRTILKLIYVCAYEPNTTMITLNANPKNVLPFPLTLSGTGFSKKKYENQTYHFKPKIVIQNSRILFWNKVNCLLILQEEHQHMRIISVKYCIGKHFTFVLHIILVLLINL